MWKIIGTTTIKEYIYVFLRRQSKNIFCGKTVDRYGCRFHLERVSRFSESNCDCVSIYPQAKTFDGKLNLFLLSSSSTNTFFVPVASLNVKLKLETSVNTKIIIFILLRIVLSHFIEIFLDADTFEREEVKNEKLFECDIFQLCWRPCSEDFSRERHKKRIMIDILKCFSQ